VVISDVTAPRVLKTTMLLLLTGDALAGRSWQGLEPQLGRTSVHAAVEGSVGIAMQYSHEPHSDG